MAGYGQVRYSILEEMEKGAIGGSVAKDLGLSVEVAVSAQRLDCVQREQICAQTSLCLLIVQMIAQNPVQLYRAEVEIQDINDNASRFPREKAVLEIREFITPGSCFSLTKANDPDVSISSVQEYNLQHNKYFKIFVVGEDVSKVGPELLVENPLDREDLPFPDLMLTVIDGGELARSDTMQLRVVVLETNNHTPLFTHSVYKVSVQEDVGEDTLLTTVTATDGDEGSNGEIMHTL
ncbi:hypothetical protein NDU88_006455 [Pleurodeles waltl]|uniref:Cadherin domain-containing protein n=1 Tax=Pleurodeles waltl TaxID=8319 RepID=A0AAV7PQQ2_PLEWA|nr:hypothetical protein NDU88_006455 [Pleurodeles waltl]